MFTSNTIVTLHWQKQFKQVSFNNIFTSNAIVTLHWQKQFKQVKNTKIIQVGFYGCDVDKLKYTNVGGTTQVEEATLNI